MTSKTRYIIRVQSKNNVLYIHIPKAITARLNLTKGDYIEMSIEDEHVCFKKI